MHLGQFSASVSVDGVQLPEYAVEYSADGKEATCWIPSENDKQFRVSFEDSDAKPNYATSGRVTLDGIACGGKGLKYIPRTRTSGTSVGARDSVATSPTMRRPLTFSKQALTDDDAYLNAAISPHLGTIMVKLAHIRPSARKPVPFYASIERPILHERSKKAMGHSVQFGPEFHAGRARNTQGKSVTIKELATFVFKYRPIGLLQAEGIAPPAAKAERARSPADDLDLGMETDEDEDARIKELEAQLEALKNKSRKNRVKREPSAVKKEIKSEVPIFRPGEVIIDLT